MQRSTRSLALRVRVPLARFMSECRRTGARQQAVLRDLVQRAADTDFGREHDFRAIRSPADYARRVPIRSWAQLAPWFDRVYQGERKVLTADTPILFHQTSGTTGKNKMIPVTARCDRLSARTHRLWVYRALQQHPRLLDGKVLGLVNPAIEGQSPAGIPVGSVSGNVYVRRMPWFVRRAYAVPHLLASIRDPDERRYAIMRMALQHDCSFLFTGNAGALLNLFDFANRHAERLIGDIHDGTLDGIGRPGAGLREPLRRHLRPRPGRARELAKLCSRDGALRPAGYWPALKVIGCWLGGTVGQLAGQLGDWCGPRVALRDIGYMASEGAFTLPLADGEPDGLLALHAMYFEFVPVEEPIRGDASALGAHELEADREYHVIITTSGGLYRYAINDIIRVTGHYRGSPLIRFMRKGDHVRNIAGELMNVDHVTGALAELVRTLGVRIRHAQVEGRPVERRYAFFLEPATAAVPHLGRLQKALDRALCRVNEVYAEVRREGLLRAPAVAIMRAGWLDAIAAERLAQGRTESQFKASVLVDRVERGDMITAVLDGPDAD